MTGCRLDGDIVGGGERTTRERESKKDEGTQVANHIEIQFLANVYPLSQL